MVSFFASSGVKTPIHSALRAASGVIAFHRPGASFMHNTTRLGADPATFTRSQFVRMPDATRPEIGVRQRVYFFNPEVLP
jgi:hypothetical protein